MRKCESYAEFLGCINARQIITNSLLLGKCDAIYNVMTIIPCCYWKHGAVRIYPWLMEQIAFDLWNDYPLGHTSLASRIYLLYIFRTSNANITRKQAFTFSTTVCCIGVYNVQWYGSRMYVICVTKWSRKWSGMINTLSPVFLCFSSIYQLMFLQNSSWHCHISIEVWLHSVSVHQGIQPSVYLHVHICVCMCLGGIYVIDCL